MTSLSDHDDGLAPHGHHPYAPSHNAPGSLRERLRLLWSPDPAAEVASSFAEHADTSSGGLESQLENAVYEALRHPGDAAATAEPRGILGELDRRMAALSLGGRFAAAIGVSAIVALFFVFLVPAPREDAAAGDGGSFGVIQTMKAALNEPTAASDDSKPALCELQNVLGSPQSQPNMSHEQSENLLQQFMQWREKPVAGKAP